MRVRWTTPATQDLYNIIRRIQQENPNAAAEVAQMESFPRRGRRGRIAGTRELVFVGLPYIAVYHIQDQNLEILRIYHGAQDWP